ncbi:MAG TPA: flagellar basal body P-ring protein FlgI [Acetobacteraceae bacterium]|nr:flagellar basal body P-ring protein FlgI [Acetobacteraceae bacterium]
MMTSRTGRMPRFSLLTVLVTGLVGLTHPTIAQVKIRDLVTVDGARSNQLVGYGLVIGLQQSGDTLRNSQFTQQSLFTMLERMGVQVTGQQLQTRNTAAVIVTANLPAFARQGTNIDVTVASLGDAKSLAGGVLMVTPLMGADGEVYAVAQGSLLVAGLQVGGQAQSVKTGVQTSGQIPDGAIVEREVPGTLETLSHVRLALRAPDFVTAQRIKEVVERRLGPGSAKAEDMGTIDIQVPPEYTNRVTEMMADLGELEVQPEVPARIVVDEKSGTIVIGEDVTIDTVAVTHGNLTVRVTETPQVSQPGPLSNGQTVVVPRTSIGIDDKSNKRLEIVPHNATLKNLVDGLNALGLGPRDLMQVLNALKASGALHAELDFI